MSIRGFEPRAVLTICPLFSLLFLYNSCEKLQYSVVHLCPLQASFQTWLCTLHNAPKFYINWLSIFSFAYCSHRQNRCVYLDSWATPPLPHGFKKMSINTKADKINTKYAQLSPCCPKCCLCLFVCVPIRIYSNIPLCQPLQSLDFTSMSKNLLVDWLTGRFRSWSFYVNEGNKSHLYKLSFAHQVPISTTKARLEAMPPVSQIIRF